MANNINLIASIQELIKQNGNQEITGNLMQQVLLSIINAIGNDRTFKGIITPNMAAESFDNNVFYLTSVAATFPNHGNITTNGLSAIINTATGWQAVDIPIAYNEYKGGKFPYTDDLINKNQNNLLSPSAWKRGWAWSGVPQRPVVSASYAISDFIEVSSGSTICYFNNLTQIAFFDSNFRQISYTVTQNGTQTAVPSGTKYVVCMASLANIDNTDIIVRFSLNPSIDVRFNLYRNTLNEVSRLDKYPYDDDYPFTWEIVGYGMNKFLLDIYLDIDRDATYKYFITSVDGVVENNIKIIRINIARMLPNLPFDDSNAQSIILFDCTKDENGNYWKGINGNSYMIIDRDALAATGDTFNYSGFYYESGVGLHRSIFKGGKVRGGSDIEINPDIYNVTVHTPLSEGYYTLDTAIAAVPVGVRKPGMIMAYQINADTWQNKQYIGVSLDNWSDVSFWVDYTEWQYLMGKNASPINVLNLAVGNYKVKGAMVIPAFTGEGSQAYQDTYNTLRLQLRGWLGEDDVNVEYNSVQVKVTQMSGVRFATISVFANNDGKQGDAIGVIMEPNESDPPVYSIVQTTLLGVWYTGYAMSELYTLIENVNDIVSNLKDNVILKESIQTQLINSDLAFKNGKKLLFEKQDGTQAVGMFIGEYGAKVSELKIGDTVKAGQKILFQDTNLLPDPDELANTGNIDFTSSDGNSWFRIDVDSGGIVLYNNDFSWMTEVYSFDTGKWLVDNVTIPFDAAVTEVNQFPVSASDGWDFTRTKVNPEERLEIASESEHVNLNTKDNITIDTPTGKEEFLFDRVIKKEDFDNLTPEEQNSIYRNYLIYKE
ncbi:MAG: hypothetical protein LBP67_04975 [Bacteroidales bacterium]|jgi:hypothetical protein|nr:hypothetical protein [Bacteroidales bacterium]